MGDAQIEPLAGATQHRHSAVLGAPSLLDALLHHAPAARMLTRFHAPMQGKADWFRVSRCRDMTIAPRATELRPVRSDYLSSQGEYDQREKSNHEVEVT